MRIIFISIKISAMCPLLHSDYRHIYYNSLTIYLKNVFVVKELSTIKNHESDFSSHCVCNCLPSLSLVVFQKLRWNAEYDQKIKWFLYVIMCRITKQMRTLHSLSQQRQAETSLSLCVLSWVHHHHVCCLELIIIMLYPKSITVIMVVVLSPASSCVLSWAYHHHVCCP